MTKQDVKQMDSEKQDALPVHESVFAAVAAAAREVRVIGKSGRNKFDGYDFASIDKFLMLVNPICGRNGLFPVVAQREVEFYENVNSKGGKSVWARFYFDITLYHASGQTLGPVNMMVAVPMNGAQTSGSAQSYALKQFFRSTLMIPTGDKDDADLSPTEAHHTPPFDAQAAMKRIRGKMALATSLDDLRDRWKSEADTIAEVKQADASAFAEIERAKNDRKAELESSDDLDGDSLPEFDTEGGKPMSRFVYFDLETIPCQDEAYRAELARKVTPPGNIKKPESIAAWLDENRDTAADEAMAKTSFDGGRGHICTIAWAKGDEQINARHAKTIAEEKAVVEAFFACLDPYHSETLVGHNITGFDIGFLRKRAIVLGVKLPANTMLPRDPKPWDKNVHDTMTMWAGGTNRISMDNLCGVLGIRGKEGFDGSMVAEAWARGDHDTIVEYCKDDVWRTREIHKRFLAVGW